MYFFVVSYRNHVCMDCCCCSHNRIHVYLWHRRFPWKTQHENCSHIRIQISFSFYNGGQLFVLLHLGGKNCLYTYKLLIMKENRNYKIIPNVVLQAYRNLKFKKQLNKIYFCRFSFWMEYFLPKFFLGTKNIFEDHTCHSSI